MLRRRGSSFYGDGNNVDISQRYAPSEADSNEQAADGVVRAALRARPTSSDDDDVKAKRVEDEVRGAMAGIDTTKEDDALLRQESPTDDWSYQKAERVVRSMAKQDPFKYQAWTKDPAKLQERIQAQAEQFRQSFDENGRLHGGRITQKPAQPQEQEKPFSSNEFWSNPEELRKAGKLVRPPRL